MTKTNIFYFEQWNPRYVAYAKAHGKTAQEMSDESESNAGYMEWIGQMWADWRKEENSYGPLSAGVHARFDAWLKDNARALE